jgi:hypothetical protein
MNPLKRQARAKRRAKTNRLIRWQRVPTLIESTTYRQQKILNWMRRAG